MLNVNEKLLKLYYETDSCVRCGRCTTVCPTYRVTRREPMVARGRIWLGRQFVEGALSLSATLKFYNDSCLGCQACKAVCPPKIRVDELVGEIKETIRTSEGRTLQDRMMLQVCSHPQSFRYLVRMLDFSRRMGTTKLLPEDLRRKARMFPPPPPVTFMDWLKRKKARDTAGRVKVGYFPGCLTDSIFPNVGMAVVETLERQGVQVIVPPSIVCCGQPFRAMGGFAESRQTAMETMSFFMGQNVDFVVTSCGSCYHSLKEYASDFREDPVWSERAETFAGKCRDIMEFLVDMDGVRVGPVALPGITVTYHDSCHLNRRLGVSAQPRKLLASLPGARYAEMPRADWCCGAAGSYAFKHTDIALKILAGKTEDARSVKPHVLTAGCPACLMQLKHGSNLFGGGYEVCHPVELLARTYDKTAAVDRD